MNISGHYVNIVAPDLARTPFGQVLACMVAGLGSLASGCSLLLMARNILSIAKIGFKWPVRIRTKSKSLNQIPTPARLAALGERERALI